MGEPRVGSVSTLYDTMSSGSAAEGRATWPDRIGALLRAALALGPDLDVDRVVRRAVESAAAIASARYTAMALYAPDGTLTFFAHHGMDDETVARIGGPPRGRGLLGAVMRADGPIRLDDLSRDPRSCGFPPGHPAMRTFLGVPVVRGDRRYGNLYLAEKAGGVPFDAEDEAFVATIAAFAAGALDHARVVETERARAAAVAALAAAEERDRVRQEMLGRVIAAQESERARVARDLHDEVGQALTSVLLGLRLVDDALDGDPDIGEARSRIGELRALVAEALRNARQLAFELRPTVLDDVGLGPALTRLVADVATRHGLRVDLETGDAAGVPRLPPDVETVVYRIVQEALTNVVRHAHARRVGIVVSRGDGLVRAVVEDDGVGFDRAATEGRLGLRGMAERAALIGGRLDLSSSRDAGTTVALEVPFA